MRARPLLALVLVLAGATACRDPERILRRYLHPKPTPSQTAEIESLYAKAIEEAKGIKEFPEDRLREAEGSLFEIRFLSVGKSAPELESAEAPPLAHDSSTNTLINRYRALRSPAV